MNETFGKCEYCGGDLNVRYDLMNDDYTPACINGECPLFDLTQLGPEVANA